MSLSTDPKERQIEPGTNDPAEAIETPQEVEESNDEKIDEDFPGYPHYPAKDDILNPATDSARVDIDVENLTRSHKITDEHLKDISDIPDTEVDNTEVADTTGEADINTGANDSDVTAEDLLILGDRDQDQDMGEDEALEAQGWAPVTGKDLDVPDGDMDVDDTPGEEDEENSYYSLGGDNMENLSENQGLNDGV